MFAPLMPAMPKVPAPFTYRLPPNHDADSYARACAAALEETIRRETDSLIKDDVKLEVSLELVRQA